jgi:hypothetical protein
VFEGEFDESLFEQVEFARSDVFDRMGSARAERTIGGNVDGPTGIEIGQKLLHQRLREGCSDDCLHAAGSNSGRV